MRHAKVTFILSLLVLAALAPGVRVAESTASNGVLTVTVSPAAESVLFIDGAKEPLTSGSFSLTNASFGTYNILVENPYRQYFFKTVIFNASAEDVQVDLKPPTTLNGTFYPWKPLGPAFFPNAQESSPETGNNDSGIFQSASGHSGQIAIDDSNADVIFQATGSCSGYGDCVDSYGGVYKTVDGGVGWTPVDFGLPYGTVTSLYLDQSDPSVLLAGFGFTSSGLYRTDDGGKYWYSVGQFGQIEDITDVNGVLLAATSDGVIESGDLGQTWSVVFSQHDIAGLSVSGNTIYIFSALDGHVYRSDDFGQTWTKLAHFIPYTFGAIRASPFNASTVYLSDLIEFVSYDGGATFAPVPALEGVASLNIVRDVTLDPLNQSRVWAIGAGYLGFSLDGGKDFTQTSQGTDNMDLVVDASNDSVLVLGSDQGIYESFDSGRSWESINGNLSDNLVANLSLSPNGQFAAIGVQDFSSFFSYDGGAKWMGGNVNFLSGGEGEDDALYINPYNSSWVYVLPSTLGFLGSPTSLQVSRNMGLTFQTIPLVGNIGSYPLVYQMFANPYNRTEVLVGTQGGIYIGSDYGTTWRYWQGSPPGVTSITMNGPDSYLVGTTHALYHYQDGTWTYNTNMTCGIYDVSVDPGNTNTSVAAGQGCSDGGIFISRNGGESYAPANLINGGELPSIVQFLNIAGDPILAAGAMGAYISTDMGQTWNSISYNLNSGDVTGAQLAGGNLYVSTYGGGVTELPDFQTSSLPATVEGQVSPPSATVSLNGSSVPTYDGHFQLFLKPGSYDFSIAAQGQVGDYGYTFMPMQTALIDMALNVTTVTTNTNITSTATTSLSATQTTTASPTTSTIASASSTVTSQGIPEFPDQALAMAALTALIVASYIMTRRRMPP